MCGSFWGVEKFKMAAVAMVTKVQNGRQIQKSSDLGEIWFPSRFLCWELISMVWEPYYDPLCRNIPHSMWQLLGVVEQIQNGGRCHGTQGTKWPPNTKFLRFERNLVSK